MPASSARVACYMNIGGQYIYEWLFDFWYMGGFVGFSIVDIYEYE